MAWIIHPSAAGELRSPVVCSTLGHQGTPSALGARGAAGAAGGQRSILLVNY